MLVNKSCDFIANGNKCCVSRTLKKVLVFHKPSDVTGVQVSSGFATKITGAGNNRYQKSSNVKESHDIVEDAF